jgi:thymidylate synthase (FAD)
MTQIEATYIDHMGSDLSVVNAARVSFGKRSECEEIRWLDMGSWCGDQPVVSQRDAKLIRYLAKHKHLSPFGHAFASFHIKAPIFVARQLVKHKFLRWNEISRRYVSDVPEFYVPTLRGTTPDKKQGSGDTLYESAAADNAIRTAHTQARSNYNLLLRSDVCEEQARMVLPQSTITEWYWSGSLDAFAAMCKLRCASDTQYETRVVADNISEKMQEIFPVAWGALTE